jgi:hypothetical protein
MSVPDDQTRQRPTPEIVHQVLSLCCEHGHSSLSHVQPIDEDRDPDYSSWLVGPTDNYVLRMALNEAAGERQKRDIELRAIFASYANAIWLPFTFAHGYWAKGLTCSLESKLWRTSADIRTPSTFGLKALAQLLTTLREIPTSLAVSIGVPVTEPRSLSTLRTAAIDAVEELADLFQYKAYSSVWPLVEALTNHTVQQLAAQPGKVLVHNSIKGDNILVLSDGRVCGLLNWADAIVGDPAEDIAGLAISVGATAAVDTARMARYPVVTCLRGIYLARCDTLIRLATTFLKSDNSRTLPVLRLQLVRAWQCTELEKVMDPSAP